MIDFRGLFAGLVKAVQSPAYPDARTIAELLNLDISEAKISKTKRGLLTIYGARLHDNTFGVDVIGTVAPRKVLNLSLPNSTIPCENVKNEVFGANQRTKPSRYSNGFAVLFGIGALTCGLTASAPDGVVEGLFCEEPKANVGR